MTYDPRDPVEYTLLRMWRRNVERASVARIRNAFAYQRGDRRTRGGLATMLRYAQMDDSPCPWGWRRRLVADRDGVELMPLWLYWLLEAVTRR